MSQQNNQSQTNPHIDNLDEQNYNISENRKSFPYETVLIKAFNKLTSEILVFLLAYFILLLALAELGAELAENLRNLLYIIPVLGVTAYIWLQQRKFAKDAKSKGINVKAGIVRASSVIGVSGASSESKLPKDVQVTAGLATGGSMVAGVQYENIKSDMTTDNYLEIINNLSKQLDTSNQVKLIDTAGHLLKQQDK